MSSNLIVDTRDFKKLVIELGKFKGAVPGAVASALNRTVDYTNTQIGRVVTKEYTIKAKDVKATLKKKKASKSNLNASIVSRGHTLSLMRFRVTPKLPSKKQPKVKIKKQGSMKPINTNPKAFVQEMKNAVGVFRRKGDSRFPVVMLRTLSIPQMISNDHVYQEINRLKDAKLEERIAHEIDYRLRKAQRALRG